MNGFPLRLGPGLPIFADDLQKVKERWKLLLGRGSFKSQGDSNPGSYKSCS